MARKQHKPEEIVAKVRPVEVLVGQGETVADGARAVAVTEATYYRWRALCLPSLSTPELNTVSRLALAGPGTVRAHDARPRLVASPQGGSKAQAKRLHSAFGCRSPNEFESLLLQHVA
jgi:hypothetical protein